MEQQAKKKIFVKAKVDHRLAPEYITMTVFQQEQYERNLPNQKIFQHKDQAMFQTLHQSNASKGRLFNELAQFKESKESALEQLRFMKGRTPEDCIVDNVEKTDQMRNLL